MKCLFPFPGTGRPTRSANLMVALLLLAMSLATTVWGAAEWEIKRQEAPRFQVVDLFLDTGDRPLAAYQLRLQTVRGEVEIVGVEGGQTEAFATPPYYDPAALRKERVILAALSTKPEADLPRGRMRVASVHVLVRGPHAAEFKLTLDTAAAAAGDSIPARPTWALRKTP